ncbi:MAG: hypothetical protein MAG551_02624 [Candidatus Scalindua arabica]|uniref:Uncharacterized protein n=1 Tax=Candidatus Scalindua arabica TaxID=1127984 RepID=A0A941W5L9_9BACT|nr:hypothetical protein [Candidatus Scalindua arabica]
MLVKSKRQVSHKGAKNTKERYNVGKSKEKEVKRN